VNDIPIMYKFSLWPEHWMFRLSFSPVYNWPIDWPNNQ
jgi:hypothetical protein